MSLADNWSYPVKENRWRYFVVFLLANCILSMPQISFFMLLAVGCLGLILPLCVAWFSDSSRNEISLPLYEREFLPPVHWLLITSVMVLGFFLRFYKLGTLFTWPMGDEGWYGMAAIERSRHWNWNFFYTTGQVPPLSVWTTAFLLKEGFSTTLAFWLPAGIVSAVTLVLAAMAFRQFFSGSFSIVAGGLWALSFWPLFAGRFCHPGPWLLPWECACLFLLGGFLKEKSDSKLVYKAAILGFMTGLGSFTFTPWPAAAIFIGVVVLRKIVWAAPRKIKPFFWFLASSFLSLLPFLAATNHQGWGDHVSSVAAWNWYGGFSLRQQALVVTYYFMSLFFSGSLGAWVPTWLGFLNPVLSSFFFLGLLEAMPYRKSSMVRWFFPVFFLFLLPGLLTFNVEGFRIVMVLPLLIFMTAMGMGSLLLTFTASWRVLLLSVVFFFSAGIDFYRLLEPFRNYDGNPELFERAGRSFQRLKAYQILSKLSQEQGPGWIFTDFDPDCLDDTTLSIMTRPFNASWDDSQNAEPRWAALFINVNYQAYLQPRFPNSQWFWVGKGLSDDGGYVLGVMPITPQNQKILSQWAQVHDLFHQTNWLWYGQTRMDWAGVFQSLEKAYPLIREDPFLSTIYWEKTAAYDSRKTDFKGALNAHVRAIHEGYATAGVYFNLGFLALTLGDANHAKEAFQKAVQVPGDKTESAAYLKEINEQP